MEENNSNPFKNEETDKEIDINEPIENSTDEEKQEEIVIASDRQSSVYPSPPMPQNHWD